MKGIVPKMTTERAAPSEPRTETGRALARYYPQDPTAVDPATILAIEAEAVHTALDELRRAVEGLPMTQYSVPNTVVSWREPDTIVRLVEYAAVLAAIEEASSD